MEVTVAVMRVEPAGTQIPETQATRSVTQHTGAGQVLLQTGHYRERMAPHIKTQPARRWERAREMEMERKRERAGSNGLETEKEEGELHWVETIRESSALAADMGALQTFV
jgi:hypothetical protein